MQVVVTGVSHKTAPLALRERLVLDDQAAVAVARELMAACGCEALALSTCNRTELYVYARDSLAAREASLGCLAERAGMSLCDLEPSVYSYSGDGAIAHLFRVTSSLDSLVVGEGQIVAQVKAAYQTAREGGCTSVVFNRLFRHALAAGKRVRTETAVGERPVSVSSVAVELAGQVFGKLRRHRALILGAGETSELTATYLRGNGVEQVLVSNRTFAGAQEMAARVGGVAVPWHELEEHLARADIVISSTSAPGYVVTRADVERAVRRRRGKPIFLIDVAVPRDLDPEIQRVEGAYLYDIDDLRQVADQNRAERERAAAQAERIVDDEVAGVNSWLRTLDVVPTIAVLRASVEEIKERELERLGSRLADLSEEQRARVELVITSIVNKILHVPTARMKDVAGRDECYLYVEAMRELFDLDDAEATADAAPVLEEEADGGAATDAAGDVSLRPLTHEAS